MTKKYFLIVFCISLSSMASAENMFVKNAAELELANSKAKPGDIITLKNGIWSNITIALNCHGTKEQPIYFKAENAGKVMITGKSKLMLGGDYIVVDGLYFTNGYAGDDAIITFRIDKKQLANNCRLTNSVINNYNNPKRMDENYWIVFYGKNNRLDNCSFYDKKNMGVMLAVILDDERSRENFHSIDHNYFGFRLPLASNTGEMIRVGVSQHADFNSNTQITDNFFEHCDGETEIISLKSGTNVIRNNMFKECQGAVVLRHGNNNTVENNIFYGNNKLGSGGVRIINKGQWVVNNLFYQCRGTGFRSPLSIMNGVPNSPAFRYVTASDAVIANNSFYESAPISFGEGADTERSERPFNIYVLNNIISNKKDSMFLLTYDKTDGFTVSGNLVSKEAHQNNFPGFVKTDLSNPKTNGIFIPVPAQKISFQVNDSLNAIAAARLTQPLSPNPGFDKRKIPLFNNVAAYPKIGARWFTYAAAKKPALKVNCKTGDEIVAQLNKNSDKNLTINLTGKKYNFYQPLNISTDVVFTSAQKSLLYFSFSPGMAEPFFMQLIAGNSLILKNLNLDLSGIGTPVFITTDTSGSSNHSNFSIRNTKLSSLNGILFNAAKYSLLDSMIVMNSTISNVKGTLFNFSNETDKKGLYNVEKLVFSKNHFENNTGQLLTMLRGGNDESTMGPLLTFKGNNIINSSTSNAEPIIHLFGTQYSLIEHNIFINSNKDKLSISFEDNVRAAHTLKGNTFQSSGGIMENKFVEAKANVVK